MFYFLNQVVVTEVFSLFDSLLNCIVINCKFYGVYYQLKSEHMAKKQKYSNILHICTKNKYLIKPRNLFCTCHLIHKNIYIVNDTIRLIILLPV